MHIPQNLLNVTMSPKSLCFTGHNMSALGRGRGVSRGRMLRGGRRGSRGGRGVSSASRSAGSPTEQGMNCGLIHPLSHM